MEEIDREISEMKLSMNARARICAEEFLKRVSIQYGFNVKNIISFKQTIIFISVLIPGTQCVTNIAIDANARSLKVSVPVN